MDTNNICRLCLVSKYKIIEFFGDEGIKLNIVKKLVQHFWFQIHRDDNLPIGICSMCWKYVNDFHEFYKNIEIIHSNYYGNLQFNNDLKRSNIKSEISDSNIDNIEVHSSLIDHSPVSHNELIEQIGEIKLDGEKLLPDIDKTKQIRRKNTFNNKTSQSLSTSLKTNSIINNNIDRRSKRNITIIKNITKILNKKLTKDIKKVKQANTAEEQQQQQCISIDDDHIINDTNQIQNKFNNCLSKDNIFINSHFIENKELNGNDGKLHNNSIRTAEDIKIREFYNLKCEICSSQHSTMSEVKKHYLNVHNSKNGYVLCCKKKLFKRSQLLEHMFWHTNPDEFRCKVCNQIYSDKSCLKAHMLYHSTPEERKYICDICGAGFTLGYHLMSHFRNKHIVQINKKFKCNQCNKRYKLNSVLQSHIRGVHELKNVTVCPVCAKVYKSKQHCDNHYLDEHVNVNRPKMQCHLCNSILKNESGLKLHIRRQHVDAPISCKLCNKVSPNTHALRKHMRDAHAERKHKCNLCDKAFKRPLALKQHMATHSGSSYLYTCPYCTTSFNSDGNMYSHRKKKHPVEWLEDRQRRLGIIETKN